MNKKEMKKEIARLTNELAKDNLQTKSIMILDRLNYLKKVYKEMGEN